MVSPELAGFPIGEKKEIEPRVRSVHGVPLADLVEGENKESPIADDALSIYSIDRPNGTEYTVVFPPLSGIELNKRLNSVSKVQAGIHGVQADFEAITLYRGGKLSKDHVSGLGGLWDVFSRSLPLQDKVFLDRVNDVQIQREVQVAQTMLRGFEVLSRLTPTPYAPIMDKERQIIDMLEGRETIQSEELIDFFDLTAREIAEARSTGERKRLSKKKIKQYMKGETSSIPKEQWNNLVLHAARKEIIKDEDAPDENSRYNTGYLHHFAEEKIKLPENVVGISRGLEYFTIPKVEGIRFGIHGNDINTIHFLGQDEAVLGQYFTFSAKVFVDESGKIAFVEESPDDVREALGKIRKYTFGGNLAVPVVRFRESNGQRGFIFNETGPNLPQEVVDEIGERVNRSEKTSMPFEEKWLSGMVGVDMLVAAHPSIRNKKLDEDDNWSSIWEKERITMSEVMDEEIKEGERTQINGPVQAGVIALHALVRYPETFDPFMDNVVSLFQKNENLDKTSSH